MTAQLHRLQGETAQAIACFRRAEVLQPDTSCWAANLGFTLQGVGRYADAAKALRKGLALRKAGDPERPIIANAISRTERLSGLSGRLGEVMDGSLQPHGAEQILDLAGLCADRGHFPVALRLFAAHSEALCREPPARSEAADPLGAVAWADAYSLPSR